MTTITKEWLQQTIAEFENTRDDIPFGLSDDDAKILIVLKRALVSLDAEPVRYLNKFSGTCVTLEQQSNAADDVAVYMPLYAAPPVQETGIYKDMLNIISLLEKNEWAEHCTSTVLGSLLESEITRLVSKEQPTPVVPESISVRQAISALESADSVTTIGQAYKMGWNACRAAMLQGGQPVSNRDELSSPVIPDGYALVPIVPTEDMVINGFESEPDPHFSDEKVWAEYEALSGCRRAARRAELCWAAMIKAAPKQEGNNG
ncbi:hypothetical protein GBH04_25290 [Salmonella enterica subsp. enterica]|nr:hypothetical protein [Salmonella enterica]EBR9919921.1 hypothetical protein [Salmonella enterica subsp. enterica serovar Richmond]EEA9090515.1 hypothetical protein [Salmonella enterica subsp. enterica]ECD2347531.1 hypothetical protein [Salmonella enterica subsp. enterica serovar Richmond]ECE7679417.1 hypothetical protein [Salmonella enterica subsp. enterica serovar Richmond]